jgi:V8-like Glu-specific endopeptidase
VGNDRRSEASCAQVQSRAPLKPLVKLVHGLPNATSHGYDCSGTLVGPSLVLTSAHCLYKDGTWTVPQSVVPGGCDGHDSTHYPVYEVWVHAGWKLNGAAGGRGNDLGLLRLAMVNGESAGSVHGYASIKAETAEVLSAQIYGYPAYVLGAEPLPESEECTGRFRPAHCEPPEGWSQYRTPPDNEACNRPCSLFNDLVTRPNQFMPEYMEGKCEWRYRLQSCAETATGGMPFEDNTTRFRYMASQAPMSNGPQEHCDCSGCCQEEIILPNPAPWPSPGGYNSYVRLGGEYRMWGMSGTISAATDAGTAVYTTTTIDISAGTSGAGALAQDLDGTWHVVGVAAATHRTFGNIIARLTPASINLINAAVAQMR